MVVSYNVEYRARAWGRNTFGLMLNLRSLSACELSQSGRRLQIPNVPALRMAENSDTMSAGVQTGSAETCMSMEAYSRMGCRSRRSAPQPFPGVYEVDRGKCNPGEALLFIDKWLCLLRISKE